MADLQEVEQLARDNNRILHKLLAHQRYSTIISVLKWLLIIGTALGAYYAIQPYLDGALKAYQDLGVNVAPIRALLGMDQPK